MTDTTELETLQPLLDNTHVTAGRYIAHIAVPCRALDEAARWYSEVLGAEPVRILKDRVTFSFGGILQLVCHLERRVIETNPRAYPRHFGLTFLNVEEFTRLRDHVQNLGIKMIVRPALRFAGTSHEHHTFMIADPSGNVIEFKCYVNPENSY
jgi:extradiol dioxygenase family protein